MLISLLFKELRRIHFIGIGGISMSALALMLLKRGFTVSGSDLKTSPLTEKLVGHGATVYLGHHEDYIKDTEAIIYTAAIPADNAELAAARRKSLPIFTRAELLGALMAEAECGIAVAGSHGKTTTTAMIGTLLTEAGLEPTVLVGGEMDAVYGNAKFGNGRFFVAEACEYHNSFLSLRPHIGIITNIDADHLDYFGDLATVRQAFLNFAKQIPPEGYLVAGYDGRELRSFLGELPCKVVTYGLRAGATWQAINIKLLPGGSSFDVAHQGLLLSRVTLQVPGLHNIQNSLAALATASLAGVNIKTITEGLALFRGTQRRFDLKGYYRGATIYDDYAHHPREIRATLAAARTFFPKRLLCVFQPHTYTRTRALLADFATAFGLADEVLLVDIFAAREENTSGISSKDLANKMRPHHASAHYLGSLEDCASYLRHHLRAGDLLLTMGAGDVGGLAAMLLDQKEPLREDIAPVALG